jgi:hypothetical protein
VAADLLSLVFQIKATDAGAAAQIQLIQTAFKDLQSAAEGLLPSLEAIKSSMTGFGTELLSAQLELLQGTFKELAESAEGIAPAMEEFREGLTGGGTEELVSDITEVEDALRELKDASEDSSSGALAESIADSVEHLQDTAEKGAGAMPAVEQGMEGATGAADAFAQVLNGELTDGMTGVLALGGPLTASFGKFATQLAANSPAMAYSIGLFAALATAMTVTGVAAANAGAHIYDLSLVTNLSAETLSGLSVAAELGGSSLDTVANAFVRLQRQVAEGSPEVLAALQLFGLTAEDVMRDLEGSIDQFLIAFNRMEPGVQRTAAVMQLFGRNGAALTPVFAEMEKGLAGVITEAKNLGVAFDESAAAKADRVDDALTKLTLTAKGLAYELGRPFVEGAHAAAAALEKLEKAGYKADLSLKNMGITLLEATSGGAVVQGILKLKELIESIKPPDLKGVTDLGKTFKEGKPVPGAKSTEELRREFELEKEREFQAKVQKIYDDARAAAAKRPKAGGAVAKDLEEAALALNRINREMSRTEDARQQAQEAADRARKKDVANIKEYYEERVRIENEFLDTALANIEKQRQLVLKDKGLLPRQRTEALEALAEKERKLYDESARRQEKFNDDRVQQEQDLVDKMESEYEKDLQNKISNNEKKLAAEKKFHDAMKRAFEQARRDREQEARDQVAEGERALKLQDDLKRHREETQRDLPGSNINIFGADPEGEMTKFEAFGAGMRGALGDLSDSFGTFRDIAGQAFAAVAAAAQQVLATFILTGKGGSFALKKLTADIIAALAIQSAVKAIFELAEGFAALANPITAWQAPFHFAAAKFYAIVAGVAGGIGLAIGAAGGLGGAEGGLGGTEGTGFGGTEQQTPKEQTLGVGDATGQIGGGPFDVWGRVINALEENTAASRKIMSQPAGEVFVQGAAQRPDAAAAAIVTHANTNADFVNQFGRVVLGPG